MNKNDITYGSYLCLDKILGAQKKLSNSSDEELFIIIHQVMELWIKLLLHEFEKSKKCLQNQQINHASKIFARISKIFEQMNSSWDVLRTMTPVEYDRIRKFLGNSSGFQSYQYRSIEFILGNKNEYFLSFHENEKENHANLVKLFHEKSLYDLFISLLANKFTIDKKLLERDFSKPHQRNESLLLALKDIYEEHDKYWDLYYLCEKLIDIEDFFRRWRNNHLITVQRIIGTQKGTGGTNGVNYLKKILDQILFPELWEVRKIIVS